MASETVGVIWNKPSCEIESPQAIDYIFRGEDAGRLEFGQEKKASRKDIRCRSFAEQQEGVERQKLWHNQTMLNGGCKGKGYSLIEKRELGQNFLFSFLY